MQKYKLEALNLLYMYYYFIIIDKSNILHVAGKLEQAEHKSRIFNMFDWIQCGRPSASHPQDAVYQNHANSQAPGTERRRYICCRYIRPRISTSNVRKQSATAADTNPFLSSKPLVDTCALRRCISKSSDTHKRRSTAAGRRMHVDRPLHVGVRL